MKRFLSLLILLFFAIGNAQTITEIMPPFNIKTVSFIQNGQNVTPIFGLNEGFQLQFDDLFGNEANYYYEIVHCDYNWVPSDIPKSEYLQGFDNQRIQDYTNSFNTLQTYSHYKLSIPNQKTQLRLSGNYILKILNEDKEVAFSRKFILYEDLVVVPAQVRRTRTIENLNYKQNLEFSIKSNTIQFQNPLVNIKVILLQNGQFDSAIKNIPPQYTLGNDLLYKYDRQTQFWAGNEFLFFDTKNIKANINMVSYVDLSGDIYKTFLYTNPSRSKSSYSNYQDVNGNFVLRNIMGTNAEVEADYSWVYFSLSAPEQKNKNIYITGMFNNYSLSAENKMDFNAEKNLYEKPILIKQGFTNYQYIVTDDKGKMDQENAIDGNFYQTENEYTILVYYRESSDRYDRIIGKGVASSLNIIN